MGAGNGPGKPLRERDKVSVVDGIGLCTRTGQALGRVVHIDVLVHWAGFLFRYVIPKRSPEAQMFTVTLVPHTLRAGHSSHVSSWGLRGAAAPGAAHQSLAVTAMVLV